MLEDYQTVSLGTRAHRSNGQCQRIRLRHLLCTARAVAHQAKGRGFRKVYC